MSTGHRIGRGCGLGWLLAALLLPTLVSPADPGLPPPPPLAEVEATWRALVEALSLGDREGVRQLTHSSRRHLLPDPLPLPPAEAYQLGFCQPQPEPLRLQADELVYRVHCTAFREQAEMVLHLRRDRDGVWRILAF